MNVVEDSEAFDVCGPLPSGVTVLEASAGTGKTFAIAALAARYVAEGTPLDKLLLVTFTRMATGELRDRVRERLVSAERALDLSLRGVPVGRDQVAELLATGTPAEVEERRAHLARAIADFDSATIETTHGFCQEVLSGLGITGDVEPDAVFSEDLSDLVEEVVDDLYVRRFHAGAVVPQFDRAEAMSIARMAVDNSAAPIEPKDAPPEMIAAIRRRLACAVRVELEARKRRTNVLTYDDLLTRLKDILAGPGGEAAADRLRARYSVVLVDEFQDTDPVQWEIMQRAFGHGDVTLVLIGDPKQAIYAFRGADVYAYLEAARAAGTRSTLRVNWRSDQALIDAYDAIFDGAQLGHEGIVYRDVRACDANQTPRLSGAPVGAPLRMRVVHRNEPSITPTNKGYAGTASAREHIARDLAADVVRLLSSGAEIERRSEDGVATGSERVRPGHIAVLVRTHKTAALVREALDEADVPAVINGAGSVFGTRSARDWLTLLEAIERPTSSPRARAAALTPFLGWSAGEVAAATEEDWEDVHRRLHHWARVLRQRGVASLIEAITLIEGLPARVLAAVDGERELTDLRHAGQLLHAAAAAERLGAAALTAWLHRRIDEAGSDTSDEERSRRLESDAEAVQVLTIHRSKGLEFPIVYCPYLWESGYIPSGNVPVYFHDPDNGDRRTIDVGLDGPDYPRHKSRHKDEQRGEDLRLAYVALTRAQVQAVVWWAGSHDARNSALGRLLFAKEPDGHVRPDGSFTPTDLAAWEKFEDRGNTAPGCIAVERSPVVEEMPRWTKPAGGGSALSAGRFTRDLDWGWRRTSYSDITAGAYEARVASEPEEPVVVDEPERGNPLPPAAPPQDSPPSLWANVPVGASVGTVVHRVLEAADFAAPDIDAELGVHLAAEQARGGVDLGERAAVVAGLRAVLETPLPSLRLRDLERADRLDELVFELPLVGGDEPSGRLTLAAVADVLREHLPPGDPLAGYAARLGDPGLRSGVRGYLTGSIDLVARVREEDGEPLFTIVDYKTNWLAPAGEPLTAWHHRPAALVAEMEHAHYALQALLYTAALHRYLRWRVAGYDVERHMGGVLYLFLRGMTGADTPVIDGGRCGVFSWRPPGALVEALSDALDSGGGAS